MISIGELPRPGKPRLLSVSAVRRPNAENHAKTDEAAAVVRVVDSTEDRIARILIVIIAPRSKLTWWRRDLLITNTLTTLSLTEVALSR